MNCRKMKRILHQRKQSKREGGAAGIESELSFRSIPAEECVTGSTCSSSARWSLSAATTCPLFCRALKAPLVRGRLCVLSVKAAGEPGAFPGGGLGVRAAVRSRLLWSRSTLPLQAAALFSPQGTPDSRLAARKPLLAAE